MAKRAKMAMITYLVCISQKLSQIGKWLFLCNSNIVFTTAAHSTNEWSDFELFQNSKNTNWKLRSTAKLFFWGFDFVGFCSEVGLTLENLKNLFRKLIFLRYDVDVSVFSYIYQNLAKAYGFPTKIVWTRSHLRVMIIHTSSFLLNLSLILYVLMSILRATDK